MFGGILPLLILGLIVWAIVRSSRAAAPATDGGDASSGLRRLFVYGLLLATLVMGAEGLRQVLEAALDRGDRIAGAAELATPLSLLVVGGGAWALLWTWVSRNLARNPAERGSVGWFLYLLVVLVTGVAVMIAGAVNLLQVLFGVESLDHGVVAGGIVWGLMWGFHTWVATQEEHASTIAPRLPGVVAAGAGFVTLAAGAVALIGSGLEEVYDTLFDTSRIAAGNDVLEALPVAIVGLALWLAFWFGRNVAADRSREWATYVFLFPILGGAVAVITAVATSVFDVLEWWLGSPEAQTAAAQFDSIPWLLATGVVGVAAWDYHRRLVATIGRPEPKRVYQYLMSAAGLITAAVGLTILLIAAFQAFVGDRIAGSSTTDYVLGGLVSLATGLPVWWWFWRQIEAHAKDAAELRSPTRRVYLVALFGITGVTALVTLVIVMNELFQALLGGDAEFPDVALAITITAGVVAGYHWTVWRRDREVMPEAAPSITVLLVAPGAGAVASRLRELGPFQVTPMEAAVEAPTPDVETIAAALTGVTGGAPGTGARRVLVVATNGEVEVVPLKG